MSKLLREGRLGGVRRDIVDFTSSIESDLRLLNSVIKINKAHIIMMVEQKIINKEDGSKILHALSGIKDVKDTVTLEDIHMYVEEEVTKTTGDDIGGNLHIAKSRNDQVSTAIRMDLRLFLFDLMASLIEFQDVLIELAEKHIETIIPGYTHLQPAQPVTFAHYILSIIDNLQRDLDRIKELYPRVNMCPMGACAIATTSFPIKREKIAELLGFDDVIENSIDAVSTRDFVLETLSKLTLIAVNLSRIAEDIIIWSSQEFHIIEIPDSFSSTSSIMPQKKNPDPVELLRAKCARVVANYFSAATIMHGVPSGYNLDFQEITPLAWESADSLKSCLNIITQLIPKLKLNKNRANDMLEITTATEIANILVRTEKLPFRMAHQAVGKAVRMALAGRMELSDLQVGDWETALSKRVTKKTMTAIHRALNPQQQIHVYRTIGSPNPKLTKQMIQRRTTIVKSLTKRTFKAQAAIMSSYKQLSTYQRLLPRS